MNRRDALGAIAIGVGIGGIAAPVSPLPEPESARRATVRQSVSRWCFAKFSVDELCVAAKDIGLSGIDLLSENEWEIPKKYGLKCAMANGFGSIPVGFNRPNQHDKLVADGTRMIPLAAAAGVPNIVCFSGNRAGLSDGEGIANCIAGFKRLTPLAEKHGVTLCLELLNSKVDHKDYQADHTAWGVEVVKGVGSPRLKLLYDIYHMQIMDGNVAATVIEHAAHIAHYHTGGVPGRHEIDETQELNYHFVARAIAATGFTGFIAHEFVPRRDPLTSLREAFKICST